MQNLISNIYFHVHSFSRFELPLGLTAILLGNMVGESTPVNAGKWAVLGSSATVLLGYVFRYAVTRSNRIANREAAQIERETQRDNKIFELLAHSIDAKRVEKHDVMDVLNFTIQTLEAISRGEMRPEEINMAHIKNLAKAKSKPIPVVEVNQYDNEKGD